MIGERNSGSCGCVCVDFGKCVGVSDDNGGAVGFMQGGMRVR